MKGLSSEKIPELAAKDVRIVKKEARIIFRISPDERLIETIENKNPRLDLIAIVGPTWEFNRGWKEVLLAEIGISRTRPYHEARGLNRKNEESNIPKRRKWFFLSPHQYQLIAPMIFKKIEGLAYERVCLWEKGPFSTDPFKLPSIRHYWLRSAKTLYVNDYWMSRISGARFTVSLRDVFIIRDICWAEANLNRYLRKVLRGLVNFIDLRLNWYKFSYKGRRPFRTLDGTKQVEERLKSRFFTKHPHLLWEVIRRLKEEKENKYWLHLAEMIAWTIREPEERKMAFMAVSHPYLSHPRTRLGDIQLLVTTEISKKKGYIVFEVFPRKK
ncbi:MAG: hypothetical protein A2V69_02340 [Candidatus Portnoybacteria bacterium RBG_13_40_8]|uniref:Uncharacterized protein n=1 Tax=Candidatus Portnoybacteria bacterium RBG_13_40_8 TaxID=1801990 RepID=A0A1G2F307_9BACT|nr:MAG: hypothetical protein A2V69_02340 [Candidatus Portnoybacteria bacterium RBG_13_40_8]OGZ35798.1 MAG: hypothetical protein A2V60_02945 [Candidatus Portnoybacteria bacterium RIFCSPHIGHO2_01_FULL_39_19]